MKNIQYRDILGENNPLYRFERLYEAAVDEFAYKSFTDASLNAILKNADMSKGSLYHHFGDKFGLYLALLDVQYKKKVDFLLPFMAKEYFGKDFFSTLRSLAQVTMSFMFADERLYHYSNRMLEESEQFLQKVLTYFPFNYVQGFGTMIQSAIDAGLISGSYQASFVAKLIEVLFINMHKLTAGQNPNEAISTFNKVIDILQYGAMASKEE